MKVNQTESIRVIGISVRTSNENMQAAQDIPALWKRFGSEDIASKIPGRVDENTYCIYTDYESDHTKPYTTILGCHVADDAEVPEGMVACVLEVGPYQKFTAKGNLLEGAVVSAWMEVWKSDLDRKYSADYECYDARAANPEDGEIDIFVALNG